MTAQESVERIARKLIEDWYEKDWQYEGSLSRRIAIALQEAEAEGARREREACLGIVNRRVGVWRQARPDRPVDAAFLAEEFNNASAEIRDRAARPDAGKKDDAT